MAVDASGASASRWIQLLLGVVAMIAVANLQYGWTLFVEPMRAAHGWERATIQVAFTVFILVQTWLTPVEGYVVDRLGPKAPMLLAGLCVGSSWVIYSYAETLSVLYLGAVMGGVGVGIVTSTAYGNISKWFADKRGLALGITAAAYGAVTAVTVYPLSVYIKTAGYQSAFFWFGIIQGGMVLCVAPFFRSPPVVTRVASREDSSPRQTLQEPAFWVMYVMFAAVAAGGLALTSQLGTMAKQLGVAATPVEVLGFALPALTLALMVDRFTSALSRPLFGAVSDWIGREQTLCIVFLAEGAGIICLALFGHDPLLFVLLSGLVFFAWGEIFSIFPALCTDLYGRRHAAANYGLLYTAKGAGALLVPVSALIVKSAGWGWALGMFAAFDITAGILAITLLRRYAAERRASFA